MSKHSRSRPPSAPQASEPPDWPGPADTAEPPDYTELARGYIDQASALRAQHERSSAVAVPAEISEAAADLLAEFDRDMKDYRCKMLAELGPILPAYVPAVRVGPVSVRDTFGGDR